MEYCRSCSSDPARRDDGSLALDHDALPGAWGSYAEEVGEVNDADARLWHPWLRINRVLRVMLHTRWSAEAWSQVRIEFKEALALRSEIRRRDALVMELRETQHIREQMSKPERDFTMTDVRNVVRYGAVRRPGELDVAHRTYAYRMEGHECRGAPIAGASTPLPSGALARAGLLNDLVRLQ